MDITNMIKNLLAELREMIKTETVVGEPIEAGDSVVIPVSKVSVGFGGGGGGSKADEKTAGGEGSGIGGGASIEPVAFIVITEGKAQLLTLAPKREFGLGKVIDLIPEILNKVKDLKSKPVKEETQNRK
ncbi:sporulation protein [candidate division KSB1 bacterium]|nr:MAG: hypothetical protein B5M50_01605 [candidate division KSB1 bacterium 4484_219]RKY80311.1 MAG: sporulation protein [candidate division KSB1 bacterium]RKY90992.1 MAG: sporulation protein [candidate division KSB1 bacterium]